MKTRVLLADDHEFFRSGFRSALETQPDLECVADVGDGRAAVAEIERLRPDVAVLDIRMPKMDGLEAAETVLSRAGNEVKVVLLTTYDDDSYIYRVLRAGASGFCLKSMPTEELFGAIRVAARGDALIDPAVTRRLVTRFATGLAPRPARAAEGLDRLTAREREILLELARGFSNAEIAARLFVGEQTVKTHVSNVLAKLYLRDRIQAVIYAHENDLL
ncbi:response regulator transcription factor [Lentzea sp.]|uniref:response regulator transcription factor n=1 Tax=Lentzea sp. TaxID=56099 RepID=UPI002ED17FEE